MMQIAARFIHISKTGLAWCGFLSFFGGLCLGDILGRWKIKTETAIVYEGYVGIIENKMETTKVY